MILRGVAIDRVHESTREGGLVEECVVGTQKVVALMSDGAVMVHLALEFDVGVVSIVPSLAVKVRLGNADVEGIIGQVGAFQLVGKVRIGIIVDDTAIWPRLVVRR